MTMFRNTVYSLIMGIGLMGCKDKLPTPVLLTEERLNDRLIVRVWEEIKKTEQQDGQYKIEVFRNDTQYPDFTAGGITESNCQEIGSLIYDENKKLNFCEYINMLCK